MATNETTVFGGKGGKAFNDSYCYPQWGQIRQIVVSHGAFVISIVIIYDSGNIVTHGGDNGADTSLITLSPDEFITKVSGRSGTTLDQIKFTTIDLQKKNCIVYNSFCSTPCSCVVAMLITI